MAMVHPLDDVLERLANLTECLVLNAYGGFNGYRKSAREVQSKTTIDAVLDDTGIFVN